MRHGRHLSRRQLIRLVSVGGLGIMTAPTLRAAGKILSDEVAPRGVARNVVLVFLQGGLSHSDTLDLKVGAWTPPEIEASDSGFEAGLWPYGLLPELGQRLDQVALIRSMYHAEQAHERAVFFSQSAHRPNPAFASETPHVGSIVASELEGERRQDHPLPIFLALGGAQVGTGYLPSDLAPFDPAAGNGQIPLAHPFGEQRLEQRLALLERLEGGLDGQRDHLGFLRRALQLMSDPRVAEALTPSSEDLLRYGDNDTGRAFAVAQRILSADLGTRFLQITLGGWDQHDSIYDGIGGPSLFDLAVPLDIALARLLDDLQSQPGERGGSLLDETLVVMCGDFGRTTGDTNTQGGRDHWAYAFSSLVAGAGVTGGRVIGATEATGTYITDPGWGAGRPVHPQDLGATIYSALGIDWTTRVTDTPSRRPFYYIEDDADATYTELRELWGETTVEV